MQKFSFYFNEFKKCSLIFLQTFLKYLQIFPKHFQSLEFLFSAIICVNSLFTLIGSFLVWPIITKMKEFDIGVDLVNVFDLLSMSILTIISGVVTVIIV